jgi:methionyl-tRNA formyltransferase
LLPKYRGAAPINRAIINGDNETGLTTFFIKQKVDTGNVIFQKRIQILEDENFGSLYTRLSEEGALLLLETVNKISFGEYKLTEQNETLASPAPKIFKEDCKINWNKESIQIHNLIRGLSPIPGAFCYYENKTLKILMSKLSNIKSDSVPGKLIIQGKSIFVNTADNFIEILELQLEGKKRIKSFEFINSIPRNKEIFLK